MLKYKSNLKVKYIRLPRFYQEVFAVLTKTLPRNTNKYLKKVSNYNRSKKLFTLKNLIILINTKG